MITYMLYFILNVLMSLLGWDKIDTEVSFFSSSLVDVLLRFVRIPSLLGARRLRQRKKRCGNCLRFTVYNLFSVRDLYSQKMVTNLLLNA